MITSIFDTLQSSVGMLNAWIVQALHGNTIVAGAVTASIIGSLFYILRKMPKQLWNRVERYVFFTYDMEYGRRESSSMINAIAAKFEYELQKRVSSKRPSARLVARNNRLSESLSNGSFFYKYEGVWIYISRHQEKQVAGVAGNERTGTNGAPAITLSMKSLRFNRSKILAMLNESGKEYSVPGVYQVNAPDWSSNPPSVTRVRNFTKLPPLAIDSDIKQAIDSAIATFMKDRKYNNDNDLPHKLTIMLYGEPGTGKSSFGEYIAHQLCTSLFCVNAASNKDHRNIELPAAIETARENISDGEIPVVLFDDIDTIWPTIGRRSDKKPVVKAIDEKSEDGEESGYNSNGRAILEGSTGLGKLLVALQSPVEINDCVVVFNTNHLEKIDPAFYRPGRVTLLLEIGRMKPKSVMEYYEIQYGEKWPEHTPIERALRGCDVSAFYAANRTDPQGFITAVTSSNISADEMFNAKELTPH